MSKKIIEAIQEAEEAALEIRKKADVNASAIITEAVISADEICKEVALLAEGEYEKKIADAKRTAEARIDENRRLSYENAASMTEIAKKKSDKAIAFVIDSILGS